MDDHEIYEKSTIVEGYFPVYVYKHGISNGLLGGVNQWFEEDQYVPQLRHFYRKGFEFGVSLWLKQREMKEDENAR